MLVLILLQRWPPRVQRSPVVLLFFWRVEDDGEVLGVRQGVRWLLVGTIDNIDVAYHLKLLTISLKVRPFDSLTADRTCMNPMRPYTPKNMNTGYGLPLLKPLTRGGISRQIAKVIQCRMLDGRD